MVFRKQHPRQPASLQLYSVQTHKPPSWGSVPPGKGEDLRPRFALSSSRQTVYLVRSQTWAADTLTINISGRSIRTYHWACKPKDVDCTKPAKTVRHAPGFSVHHRVQKSNLQTDLWLALDARVSLVDSQMTNQPAHMSARPPDPRDKTHDGP